MLGYRLINYYKDSSIFIKSKNAGYERSSSSEIDNYVSSDGFVSSVQLDYETNDDYMKNFKHKYASVSNSKQFEDFKEDKRWNI